MIEGNTRPPLRGNTCLNWRGGCRLSRVPTNRSDPAASARGVANHGIFCESPMVLSRKAPTWSRKRPSTMSYVGVIKPTNHLPAWTLSSCTGVAAQAGVCTRLRRHGERQQYDHANQGDRAKPVSRSVHALTDGIVAPASASSSTAFQASEEDDRPFPSATECSTTRRTRVVPRRRGRVLLAAE